MACAVLNQPTMNALIRTCSLLALASCVPMGLFSRGGGSQQDPPPPPQKPVATLTVKAEPAAYCAVNGAKLEVIGFDAQGVQTKLAGKVDITTDPPGFSSDGYITSPVRKSLELLGTPIKVTVTYTPKAGGPALTQAVELAPDYCGKETVELNGEQGDGGGFGQDGQRGGDAGEWTIEVDSIAGPEGKPLAVAAFARTGGPLELLAAFDPAKGPLHVYAQGGSGGAGGPGNFATECTDATDGGVGGEGGKGGTVTLVVSDHALEKSVLVSVGGGSGGSAGVGGGESGLSSSSCEGFHGKRGRDGREGRGGREGTLKVVVKKKPPLVEEARATCPRCRSK